MTIRLNNLKRTFFAIVLCGLVSYGNCQSAFISIDNALANNDYKTIISESTNEEAERYILDVLSSSKDFCDLDYEQLVSLATVCNKDSRLHAFLDRKTATKEKEILSIIDRYSLEEIVEYAQKYPQRQEFVHNHLARTLLNNLDKLSCKELLYIQSVMPKFHDKEVKAALKERKEEKHKIMSDHIKEFMSNEKKMSSQLKYMLETISWSYFMEGHKQLTNAYSEICMVPDNPSSAAAQYQRILKICLSPQTIRDMLQEQVNKYCEQVNKARRDYALIAGKENYVRCNFLVPVPQINSTVSISPFNGILESRESYIRGRQNVSQGSSVLGFIFGGLWGLGVQALGDWLSISDLVDAEYNYRKKYVESVHSSVERSFSNYTAKLIENFNRYMINNQKEYETSIKE